MILPTTEKENQLIRVGHKYIAGVDEVGRGPLAGPVVAGAVVFQFSPPLNFSLHKGEKNNISIRDSKLLSENQRIKTYKWIVENCLAWSVGIVSQEKIDEFDIRRASLLAMKESIEGLSQKPDAVLIDGKDTIDGVDIYQESVIKGDRDIFSIAAASIIAKVTRDEIMKEYDKIFPQYGFAKHKGYGTAVHIKAITEYGVCPLHRKSFSFKKN